MLLDREPKPGQLWSHYKHPDNLYEIKGINVATKETVAELIYFAKKEDTLEDLAVYITSKGNLKLYYVQLQEGKFKKLGKVIKEPHVIYQSKIDEVVWARLYDKFVDKVQLPSKLYLNLSGQFVLSEGNWINRFERVQ